MLLAHAWSRAIVVDVTDFAVVLDDADGVDDVDNGDGVVDAADAVDVDTALVVDDGEPHPASSRGVITAIE